LVNRPSELKNPDSLIVQMLKTMLGLMDVKETGLDKWLGLFMDMLAGDKSLLQRFLVGFSLSPCPPCFFFPLF